MEAEDSAKHWYLSIKLHGIKSQKLAIITETFLTNDVRCKELDQA
jgi:hypothetical protein